MREEAMNKPREGKEDPTKPEFFALWSLRQLHVECVRLNQVLKECSETLTGVEKIEEEK